MIQRETKDRQTNNNKDSFDYKHLNSKPQHESFAIIELFYVTALYK